MIKNLFNKKYLSILLALIVSYSVVKMSINNVFIANSPEIRQNLGTYLLVKITNIKENVLAKLNLNFSFFSNSSGSVANNQTREQMTNFLKANLKPVAKGVSAATKDQYNYIEFTMDKIEWVMIEYTLKNGKIIKIRYPKGTEPPPKEIYE